MFHPQSGLAVEHPVGHRKRTPVPASARTSHAELVPEHVYALAPYTVQSVTPNVVHDGFALRVAPHTVPASMK